MQSHIEKDINSSNDKQADARLLIEADRARGGNKTTDVFDPKPRKPDTTLLVPPHTQRTTQAAW
ncbi:hypothetical protein ACHAXS_012455 [Conticribra weissflogii]